MTSPVDNTARDLIPRSIPTTALGRRGAGSTRSTSTEKDTNQRPDWWVMVAERMRPVPRATCRASVRVDSCVRTTPIRGSRTCRRSVSTRPNAPVVNRHDSLDRFPLNLGNRTLGPRRVPLFDVVQLPSAVARFANPDEYASFEFSTHHGAMVSLAWFHRLRRL